MRIRLILEYDGTNYAGWQRQSNAVSVQQKVEEALSALTKRQVTVTGASRTDAGVHALGQVAHFDTESRIPPDKYAFALNTMLPPDIRVQNSAQAADDFHARFMAKGKLYRYRILSAPHASALERDFAAHTIYPLSLGKMQREARSILGTHDFKPFAASGSIVKDTVRAIASCEISQDGAMYTLFVCGNGFLYNMVRIFAGTLILVGAGRLEEGAIRRALDSGSRLDLGITAPACGLTLMEVYYDD
ncbi:MAG: tRNA pseudouridine(38-40) synthase TruA [Christensenellales bacterium]|jgi:tRNA pseudouridine38-40 synthase